MEQLPREVLENVLRRLSVYDIVRAGCACKVLRALVSSHTFTSSDPPVSLLLLPHLHDSAAQIGFNAPPAWAYDGGRDAWLALPLAFLQPYLPEFAYPVASDGGFICFGSGRDFIICNPITKSWKRFPHIQQRLDEDAVQAFGLNCNPTSGTYDFFLLNHCASKSQIGVSRLMNFSSSSSQWRGMPPLMLHNADKLHSNAIISCNSRVYTMWQRETFFVIFAFHDGVWSEVEVPDCRSTLLKAFLMDVSGSLYMVGGVGVVWLQDDLWERPTTVRIWKLLVPSNTWMEVTRMPAPILHEFYHRVDFDELQCRGKNGLIYMKSLRSDVLMFELCTNQWKWLKDLEMDVDCLALVFEPSLSAMV